MFAPIIIYNCFAQKCNCLVCEAFELKTTPNNYLFFKTVNYSFLLLWHRLLNIGPIGTVTLSIQSLINIGKMTNAAGRIFTGSGELANISTAYFILVLLTTTLMFC